MIERRICRNNRTMGLLARRLGARAFLTRWEAHRMSSLLFLLVALLCVVAGCSTDSTSATVGHNTADQQTVSAVGPDGTNCVYEDSQLLVGGTPLEQGPFAALDETAIRERVASAGQNAVLAHDYRQAAYYDAASGKLAWEALTCHNPDCASQQQSEPLLFVKVNPHVRVDEQGQVVFSEQARRAAGGLSREHCPVCNRFKFVRPYLPPEVVARRQQLHTLKQAVRVIRRQAKASGTAIPADLRTPTDIDRELAALPAVYLTD